MKSIDHVWRISNQTRNWEGIWKLWSTKLSTLPNTQLPVIKLNRHFPDSQYNYGENFRKKRNFIYFLYIYFINIVNWVGQFRILIKLIWDYFSCSKSSFDEHSSLFLKDSDYTCVYPTVKCVDPKIYDQAKESIQLLETFQKQTWWMTQFPSCNLLLTNPGSTSAPINTTSSLHTPLPQPWDCSCTTTDLSMGNNYSPILVITKLRGSYTREVVPHKKLCQPHFEIKTWQP
jgi:hypothetical protein